jgi:hypothetical protein
MKENEKPSGLRSGGFLVARSRLTFRSIFTILAGSPLNQFLFPESVGTICIRLLVVDKPLCQFPLLCDIMEEIFK